MTWLMRLTPYGLAELRRRVREHGTLPDDPDDLELPAGSVEEHPARILVDALAARMRKMVPRGAAGDADDATAIHEALRMPRRVAADRMIWPWLAACAFPEYTRARWSRDDRAFFHARIDDDVVRNAFARLWWGVEHTRVDNAAEVVAALGLKMGRDRYAFTRLALSQYALQFALANRDLYQSRTATVAFLAVVQKSGATVAQVEDLIKWFNLGLSTVLLEGFEDEPDPDRPYRVDPARCAALCGYLDRLREACHPGAKKSEALDWIKDFVAKPREAAAATERGDSRVGRGNAPAPG